MPLDMLPSVCPHDCPSTCALEVERIDARTIGRVRGAAGNSYTAGVVCAKTARYAERVHHPDRLRTPLLRHGPKGSRQFREIGWDEALDRVAAAFQEAAARHGAEAVWPYYYAGTMGLVQRDGINRLRHVMGYSRQDSTFCVTLVDAGWNAGVGGKIGVDPREMAEADLIVMWGGNPVATQVNVMTHIARARKERGAKLVVVDPYRSGTAEAADMHLMPRPGTDGALACAVMGVILAEGLADRDFLAERTDFTAAVEAHLRGWTPERAAAVTGVPAAAILAFARLYGGTPRAFLRLGYGLSRSRNGAAQVHAVSCLPALTGAWKHRGGGALYSLSRIYHWDKTLIEGLDAVDPATRVLDQAQIGRVLTGDATALRGGPPVTAMLVQNTNPAVVAPESLTVRRGLSREDLFLCVHEQFLTDTAAYADVVLPATSFLEHPDLYQAGGHPHIQVARPVIEPFADCRSNHAVLCGLAARLGADHPGFRMSEWELIDATLKASGWPGADTVADSRWLDVMPAFADAHMLNGFPQPDGRFRFRPDWQAIGPAHGAMSALPDHLPAIEEADDEHPLRMVTAPARQFLNTTFTETPGSLAREKRPTVMLHPDDAARLGIADGALARIGNRRGSVLLHAAVFDGLQPGVVVVESVWPNGAFIEGIGINALTSADPGLPAGGAVYHDTAVWLRPAG